MEKASRGDAGAVNVNRSEVTYNTKEEYFAALQKWLQDAYMWQHTMSCLLPSFMLTHPELMAGMVPPSASMTNGAIPSSDHLRRPLFARPTPGMRVPPTQVGSIRYRIPPFWKRFCAEIVDSAITFILKLFITFIAIYVFDFIDLDKYNLDMIQQNVQSFTYKMAVEMTSQLLILEVVNRFVACFLEAYWLRGGEGGRIGGATPGKSLLGLKVVLCHQLVPAPGQPNDVVIVSPGTDLGWGWALVRALSKSVFLALIYPLCFAFFFFKYNRLGYDIFAHSVVVEDVDNRG